MAGWRTAPAIMPGTRTSWTSLPDGGALKLKGVGYREAGGAAEPPVDVSFHRPNPHLGIRDDGELTIVPSSPSPYGGMLLTRARAEYEVAAGLARAAVPAVVPLRVYRYEGVSYTEGGLAPPEAMGAVLTLAPAAAPHRADLLIRASDVLDDDERERLGRLIGPPGAAGRGRRRLELITVLAARYGAALRGFAQAGFFRYSGSLDNWALADAGDQVYLTDLDSSLPLSGCTPVRAPLEVMRDMASGLFNIAAALMHPDVALQVEPAEFERTDPFAALLSGYCEELPRSAVLAGAERFRAHWTPLLIDQRRRLLASTRGEPFERVWMGRRATFALALSIAYDLYARSDLRQAYGIPCSRAGLRERIARFVAGAGDPPPR